MTGSVYACVCHTCEEEAVHQELARAQAFFADHVDRGCEVVLRNVDPAHGPRTSAPGGTDPTAGNPEASPD